ncbi:MAG: S8 family serine peptidase [Candidatus Gracilibacteria bacterium]|nr:S8 family serine peptidase [Candidatus Gracilibacteria bacterium]
MKKILLGLILIIGFFYSINISAFNEDELLKKMNENLYNQNEKSYCKVYNETITLNDDYTYYRNEQKNNFSSDKFWDYSNKINEIFYKIKNNQEWMESYKNIYKIGNNIDCYKATYGTPNKNNYIYLTDSYPEEGYMYSYSSIAIEGKGFENNINKNVYIYFVVGSAEFQVNNYKKFSNEKIYINLPDAIIDSISNGVVVGVPYYEVKYCVENECAYTPIKSGGLTNDNLSYQQYYLYKHNILSARNTITNPKKVKIAVIDDGVSLNHPDLTNKIWVNKNEIPGNGIDDDKNGYVDDYNSWNFVYNGNNTKPLGTHGTKVAGIIGAQINNNEGIGGIVDNVELMSVGVCNKTGCEVEKIIEGIYYAVDNGANIINLSLGGNQFNGYDKSYDEALKYAYDNNIIVVIAGGNGDVLSNNGVNTTINKISPVCNNGDNYKNIIGVGAFTSKWSNYGDCIDFYTVGEKIMSTSFGENSNSLSGENYTLANGTSFSAPILTGIIGLGYEKYGIIDRNTVYDALTESDKDGIIDALEYINVLGKKLGKSNNTKKENVKINTRKIIVIDDKVKNENLQKEKADKIFVKIINILNKYPKNKKDEALNSVITKLNILKTNESSDKIIMYRHLINLINKELGKCDEVQVLLGLCSE